MAQATQLKKEDSFYSEPPPSKATTKIDSFYSGPPPKRVAPEDRDEPIQQAPVVAASKRTPDVAVPQQTQDVAPPEPAQKNNETSPRSPRGYRQLVESERGKNDGKPSGIKGLVVGLAIFLVVTFAIAALITKVKETVSTIVAGMKSGMDRPQTDAAPAAAPSFNLRPQQFGSSIQPLPKATGFSSFLPGSFAARGARFGHRIAPHEAKHHGVKATSAGHKAKQSSGHLFIPSEPTFTSTNAEPNPETL
jgi:hypothetical protein